MQQNIRPTINNKTIKRRTNNINKNNNVSDNNNNSNKNNNNNNNNNKTCKQYKPFEKKVEMLFKKQHIDYVSTNYNLSNELIKDLKKAVNTKNIEPTDDYYSYINDRWINNKFDAENYKYLIQYDDFRIIQDKVFKDLIKITDNFVKKKIDDTISYEYKLQKCMTTFKTALEHTDDKTFMQVKHNYVNQINNLCNDKKNIWKMLALLNNYEVTSWGAPIVWKVLPDDKNPKLYKTYIGTPNLSLIVTSIYLNEKLNAFEEKYLKTYHHYLHDLFEVAFGKNNNFDPNDVFECEKKIANALYCNNHNIKDDIYYNLVTKSECLKTYNFDWEQFVTELGYKTVPSDFVCSSTNYFYCIVKLLLDEWNSKQWQTYYIYIYIRQLERLTKNGPNVIFNFEGKFVNGQKEPTPPEITNLTRLEFAFPHFYNNEYIKQYSNNELVEYAKGMAEDLKEVFIRIIKRNSWMQPKTKQKALQKLYSFKMNIGSTISKDNDTLLDYNSTCSWTNILKKASWRKKLFINLDGKEVINDIFMLDWSLYPAKFIGNQSFIVNAMYTPSQNAIDIPCAYLQKPFIDLEERGIEYNLAHIGFTIGHEMSHSLDDWGSNYDENGRLHNWWTKKDKHKFEEIQKDIIEHYEKFASYDNIHFDASISIGEDLADISGLAICLEYLRDFQLKNQDVLPIKRLSFQAFFVYFAFQQRQKISKKSIQAQLITNPHPLDKYRTNVPLSRLEVFRNLYNIKKGDKMWWHSTNTVWAD
jgi:putative endopeptidase